MCFCSNLSYFPGIKHHWLGVLCSSSLKRTVVFSFEQQIFLVPFVCLHCSMLCLLITLQVRLLHLFLLVSLIFCYTEFHRFFFFLQVLSSLIYCMTPVAVSEEALSLLFGQNYEHLTMVRLTDGFCYMNEKVVICSLLYNQTLKIKYFLSRLFLNKS